VVYAADTLARNREADLTWFGVRYNLGPATLFASHATREDKMGVSTTFGGAAAAVTTRADIKVSNIGVQVPMGATTLFASMYNGTNKATTSATDDREIEGYQLGGTYSLSKRTRAYLVVGENENNAKTVGTSSANVKFEQTSIGLVHTF
jgi:predicted porin